MLFQSVADSILAMITIENKCSAWIKTERKQIVMGNHKNTDKTEDYSFQVDLRGIIRLLSENLYSSEDVFLRELLQNAVDAIEARKAAEPDFGAGQIRISYRRETKNRARLIFADNGIGLTREEIHTFLSVIGQSSKRGALERGNFIGQFGIGLLSCFLVADEILVRSRSLKEEAGHRWLGKSDGTYQVAKEPEEVSVGTEVILLLKGKMAARYHEEEVIRLLKEYGFLLKTPVEFDGDGPADLQAGQQIRRKAQSVRAQLAHNARRYRNGSMPRCRNGAAKRGSCKLLAVRVRAESEGNLADEYVRQIARQSRQRGAEQQAQLDARRDAKENAQDALAYNQRGQRRYNLYIALI